MATGRRELMIGARVDPVFGPVVLVGDGGKYVEAMPDSQVLLAPFDLASIEAALRRLRIAPLLDGVRGEPALDVAAFCAAALQVGRLMLDDRPGDHQPGHQPGDRRRPRRGLRRRRRSRLSRRRSKLAGPARPRRSANPGASASTAPVIRRPNESDPQDIAQERRHRRRHDRRRPPARLRASPTRRSRCASSFPIRRAGPTDIVARLVGSKLEERFKQPFVIDNKPGAGGNLGAEAVARAAPDGYIAGGRHHRPCHQSRACSSR